MNVCIYMFVVKKELFISKNTSPFSLICLQKYGRRNEFCFFLVFSFASFAIIE
uniref:Uncharacterized protein n=1 Tax=Solanum lycopersicum TaxID=4081 RepID=A0A494G8M8_SOLLC